MGDNLNGSSIEQNYSVIAGVSIDEVKHTMDKIHEFQDTIHRNLKQGHDYGIVPGSKKPTLLKPGAEKILMLLGLTNEYQIIEKVHEYESGFFAFTVCCKLFKDNKLITEGVGHCNTKERRYINQDPYTLANTCLKMAKKRAQIDATLTVASLSEVFTQDIEDMDLQNVTVPEENIKSAGEVELISKAQAKRLFAMSKGDADLCKIIISKYGYKRSDEIKKADYERIASEIEDSIKKEGAAGEVKH